MFSFFLAFGFLNHGVKTPRTRIFETMQTLKNMITILVNAAELPCAFVVHVRYAQNILAHILKVSSFDASPRLGSSMERSPLRCFV